MSRFALIPSDRKIYLTNEVINLLAPNIYKEYHARKHELFVHQSMKNDHNYYFKIVYKNEIFTDHIYTEPRSKTVSLHPSLHAKMDDILVIKKEADDNVSKIRSLMNKIFLKAKSETDAYTLLPDEIKGKLHLVFDLSEHASLTSADARAFLDQNQHIMKSVYEKIFVGQMTGKI